MTAELQWYLVLCVLAFFYCFMGKRPALVWLSYGITGYYMWVVRSSGFDYDMQTYAAFLHFIPDLSSPVYYLREFVYWGGSGYIFSLIQDEVTTFWVIDMIWMSMLFYAIGNSRQSSHIPLYVVPFMMVFFPVLMGYENVYRQLIACALVLYAFFGVRNIFLSGIIGVLALFTHNAAIVYMPLLYLFAVSSNMTAPRIGPFHKGVFMMLYMVMLGGVYYSSLGDSQLAKSSSSTGESLTYAYLLVFMAMTVVALILDNFNLTRFFKGNISLVYSMLTYIAFIPVLGGAQAERIGMMLLILTVPIFAANMDRSFSTQNEKMLTRMLFVMLGIAPTFLFYSAFNFLLTEARMVS